jgi:ribosomal protein L15
MKKVKTGVVVDTTFLKAVKLVPMRTSGAVKIIGKGEVASVITLKGIRTSAGVKTAIEKGGGKVVN